MQLAIGGSSRRFELIIRCENCMRESVRCVPVPDVDDAPSDVDELIESSFLGNMRFSCRKCEGVIGLLVGASRLRETA